MNDIRNLSSSSLFRGTLVSGHPELALSHLPSPALLLSRALLSIVLLFTLFLPGRQLLWLPDHRTTCKQPPEEV